MPSQDIDAELSALLASDRAAASQPLLYHRAGALYRAGDLIQPGNWGRAILGLGPNHARFYPEYLLERIRRAEFGSKPSRMDCAFAFENFETAKNFQRAGVSEHIYAVRPAGPNAETHRGDMGWIDALPLYRTFDGVEQCVRRYWAGDAGDDRDMKWEIVVAGPLVVVARITKIPDNGH